MTKIIFSKIRYSTEKPYDDEARTFGTLDTDPFGWLNENSIKIIAAVVIFIALLVVLCYFYRCCKRLTKSNKIWAQDLNNFKNV